jgi:1-acyl-sn-glycerol-3-phosphate acyltransferase
MVYWIVRALTWLLIRTQMRLNVEGIEHIPRSGPVLLVSNHLGPADHFAIGVRVPRKVRILAKAEIFEWPVLGWIARQAGAVRIRRGESDRDALRVASRLLAQGECLLVFPEGTYSHPPEPVGMLPLKSGAAWLALRSRATVVPLAIIGAEQVWIAGRGWRPGRRPRVRVVFGEPYRPAEPAGAGHKGDLAATAAEMGRRVAALLPPSYRGPYADAPVPRVELPL